MFQSTLSDSTLTENFMAITTYCCFFFPTVVLWNMSHHIEYVCFCLQYLLNVSLNRTLGSCFQNSVCLLYVPGDTLTFEHVWKIASEIGGALKNIHLCQLNSFLVHMLQWKWRVNATVCLISCALIVRWPIYHWLWCFNCFNGSNGGDHIRSSTTHHRLLFKWRLQYSIRWCGVWSSDRLH